ncbi:MAG: LPS export ABC transporter permease LptF [Hyphomicrobiales bacterium]
MKLVERYIFRQVTSAFLFGLIALAGVLYVTQALRELDLVTSKGQTLAIFFSMTALWMPMLVMIIAPVALLIAAIYTFNRLNSDSELVVMTAAGMNQWRLMRPLLMLAIIVSLVIASISLYISPRSLKAMRYYINEVRTDLVANILKEGRFTEIEKGLVFHIRERTSTGQLKGILVSDDRDPELSFSYIAEDGMLVDVPTGAYLVLQDGNIQRRRKADGALNIVKFERYAFDLSQFTSKEETTFFKPREQLTSELFDTTTPAFKATPGRVIVELHDRLSSPLYPIAFAMIAMATLGQARTTRQARGGAIFFAIVFAGGIRLVGFAGSSIGAKYTPAVFLMYAAPIGATLLAILFIASSVRLRLPTFLARPLARISDGLRPLVSHLSRRFGLAARTG